MSEQEISDARGGRVHDDVTGLLQRIHKAHDFFVLYKADKQHSLSKKKGESHINKVIETYSKEQILSLDFTSVEAAFLEADNVIKANSIISDLLDEKENSTELDAHSNTVAVDLERTFNSISNMFYRENKNTLRNRLICDVSWPEESDLQSSDFHLHRNGKKFLKNSGLSITDIVMIEKISANLNRITTKERGFTGANSVRVAVGLRPI